ncbi:MAG TPA: hypothetical protein PLU36_06890 [Chitinophagaceae bacterium]|nr:hypothetical protein [Chitinophagaceae bacterium]MCC6635315.1 hypothetical protein [Chitinophagaceae bacterium]HMZ46513.1 hypothetical protein [Chitinophagaceae bacterium]HNE93702.1 hypothetical protein [Chitinophagaceae bacterium]HNF30420.1 hypothetical protein [Chitinophagaceae bacterium]
MLEKREEDFITFWEKNRLIQKKNTKQFILGLTFGLFIGLSTLMLIFSGWYQRATMVATTRLNPFVFIVIIVIIAVFMAYLNRKFKWERHEQQYLELLAKKQKLKEKHTANQEGI